MEERNLLELLLLLLADAMNMLNISFVFGGDINFRLWLETRLERWTVD